MLAFTDNDQTIDGAGTIVGQDNAALITIAVNRTLTNETTIEGQLEITGAAPGDTTFRNHGTVHANVAGTLLISTGSFDDDSTALWEISGNQSARLTIAVGGAAAALQGAFEIHNGGFLSVTSSGFHTSGPLEATNGWISVVATQELIFSE